MKYRISVAVSRISWLGYSPHCLSSISWNVSCQVHNPGQRVMLKIKPSRTIGQVASWRLAAEIVRRYPGRFFVIEMHPVGGTYDCIGLISRVTR